MKIRSFLHKGIKRLYMEGSAKGLPADAVNKLRNMLAFLDVMAAADELRTIPHWKAHALTGNRKGTWALHVTKNWRLTFRIEADEICDLNFEDYH
jgi:proteic killer suppression protein